MLQRLAGSGTASTAHISGLPQQTVAGSNGPSHSLQSVLPVASISVTSQIQQQITQSSDGNTSVQQQTANAERCLNSSVTLSDNITGRFSQSSQLQTESCQYSKSGLPESASVDVLQSCQVLSGAETCGQSQQAQVTQLQQLGQSTDVHFSSHNLPSPTQSEANNHSRVIEQLQLQLLQSSARQAINGCHVTAAGGDSRQLISDCKGEEGEVDSNELMQFLS